MAKIKPINLESDTFEQMKKDMTASINRLLRLMQRYDNDKASLTLKLTVTFEEEELDDGNTGIVPTFEHKITTTVQRKDDIDGKLPGEYVLADSKNGGFELRPISGQIDMFEEAN